MKTTTSILATIACLGVAFAAMAEEAEEPVLVEHQETGRWHISAGARLAPGVKTRAIIPSGAILDVTGRLRGADGSKRGRALPSGSSSSTEHSSSSSTETSSESVSIAGDSLFEFENGFVDMNDTTDDPNETWYWHFDSADAFNDASGTVTGSSAATTTTSSDSTTASSAGKTSSSSSLRSSFSEEVSPDIATSHESDLWGADFEVGYDLWRGERFTLGIGLGATFYRCDDAIRATGRAYAASAETQSESATGRIFTTTETTVDTSATTTETTSFTAPNLAGSLSEITNDNGSIGGGTADGLTNPDGGPNPSLILSDGSVTKTTTTETRTDTTVKTTSKFESTGSRSSRTSSRRTIDVGAEGDVETQELRLALQPSWKAADWLELRGSLGAVATRVDIDVDATIFVNGARYATVSGDDDDWVFAGLCGLDAVIKPRDWLELTLGADLRIGDTGMDYRAGLVRGTVDLARYTVRAGIGIRF